MRFLLRSAPAPPYSFATWSICAFLLVVYVVAAVHLGPLYATGLSSSTDVLLAFYERYGVVPRMAAYQGWAGPRSLITGLVVHTGPFHLFVNAVLLRLLGASLEARDGPLPLLVLFVVSGVLGAAAHCWVYPTSNFALVGASGSVAGLVGAHLAAPGAVVRVALGPAGTPLRVSAPLWGILSCWAALQLLSLAVQLLGDGSDGVAFAPHLGGLVVGLAWGRCWLFLFGAAAPDGPLGVGAGKKIDPS